MKELDKLEKAAESLEFQLASKVPPTSAVIGGRDYAVCAVDDPFAKKIYINKPTSLQCQAMRAILYFWKVLRVREAVVYENDAGHPSVKLDFGEARVDVELPNELGMGPVSPVRMIANIVFGKLHDEAIATRGQMASEALESDVARDLVQEAQGSEDGVEIEEEAEADVTGVRRMPAGESPGAAPEPAAMPSIPPEATPVRKVDIPVEATPEPMRVPPRPAAPAGGAARVPPRPGPRPVSAADLPRPSVIIGGSEPGSPLPRPSRIIGAPSVPIPVGDDDVIEEIEDISDSLEVMED